MTAQLDFKASIELGIDRERSNRFVRVTKPDPRSPMTAKVRVLGMTADVVFGTNGTEKPEWDQAKADELQAALLVKLHEVIDASELMTTSPTLTTPGSAAFTRIANKISAEVLAYGNTYQETELFETVVTSAAPTLLKANAVAAAVAKQVNPHVVPPVIVPVDPVDPEEPGLEEGATVHLIHQSISSQFLTNGNLFVGSGIPGNTYNIARNDLIELALVSHRRSAWEAGRTLNPDGSVELDLTGPTDRWGISWSIGALHEELTDITSEYDVELLIGLNADGTLNEGEFVRFALELDVNNEAADCAYLLRETTGITNSVTDSKGDPAGMSIQNTSSHHWFKGALIPAIDSAEAVVGIYQTVLRATHKVSGNVVEASVLTSAEIPA